MKAIGIIFAYLVGSFLVLRAIVELVTIDDGDASSYEDDWGGPSLLGVLAMHCLPGVIAAPLMTWGARRRRRAVRPFTGPGVVMDAKRWPLPDDLPLGSGPSCALWSSRPRTTCCCFHTRDPTSPELGEWWELPGGGIESGESYEAAAIRELREETGIVVTEAQVGAPTWRRHATFRYRGERRLQHEAVVTVHPSTETPSVDGTLRVGFEDEDYFDYRWWPVDKVAESFERFYPGWLPEFVRAQLEGEKVDEPFEIWS